MGWKNKISGLARACRRDQQIDGFLESAELAELETELPALGKVIRAHQAEIIRLSQSAHRASCRTILVLAVAAFLLAWAFRYEPMPPEHGVVMLDRWTGNLLVMGTDEVSWVDVQSFETKGKP